MPIASDDVGTPVRRAAARSSSKVPTGRVSMMNFRRLSELFSIPLRNGLNRPKSTRGSGTRMVNMGEIFAHRRIGDIEMARVQLNELEMRLAQLEKGDLLFARQSLVLEGAGKCVLFLGGNEPVTFESHIIRCRLNTGVVVPSFLFYYFESSEGKANIQQYVEQQAAAGIRGSDLARVEVPVPPLKEQQAIAELLVALDDKIDLNRQMNRTLEEMASALFKSLFIDFDPVVAKSEGRKPVGMDDAVAALFPAAFVETEEGPIPNGWKWGSLLDIADNRRRGTDPRSAESGSPYIGLEHMPLRSISLSEWGHAGSVSSNKFSFRKGEFLFGKLRPYFHKVGVAQVDGVCSTDVLVIVPRTDALYGPVLGYISSSAFVDYTDAGSDGTRMPRTNWHVMGRYPVVIPDPVVAQRHTEIVRSWLDQIGNNIHESRTLASLRDLLLPKLLSGEIRLKDAETAVAETL
jgi:type I restriction enzyme, S subunit